MTHLVQIWFDDQYAARKWCLACKCGWVASCRTEKEAQDTREAHLAQQGQNEKVD